MTLPAQRVWDTSPWFDVQATGSGVHAVSGELDMSTAPALRTYLKTVVAGTPVDTTIVVDLSRVTFTDIVGLDPLLEARSQLAHGGRRLMLRGAPAGVTKLLRLLGQDYGFPTIIPTV